MRTVRERRAENRWAKNQQVRDQRGGVLAEVALSLPLVVFTILAGLVLGYMAYVKVALALTARQAAREAVIRAEHGLFRAPTLNKPYGYNGVVDTYGLSRRKVETVIMAMPGQGKPAIHVITCYRMPAAFPDISSLKEMLTPAPPRVDQTIKGNAALSKVNDVMTSRAVPDEAKALYADILEEARDLEARAAQMEASLQEIKANLTEAHADFKDIAGWTKRMWDIYVTHKQKVPGQDTKLLQSLTSRPEAHTVAQLEDVARYRCGDQDGGHMMLAAAAYPYTPPPQGDRK